MNWKKNIKVEFVTYLGTICIFQMLVSEKKVLFLLSTIMLISKNFFITDQSNPNFDPTHFYFLLKVNKYQNIFFMSLIPPKFLPNPLNVESKNGSSCSWLDTKLTYADNRLKYQIFLSTEDCAKRNFKNEWSLGVFQFT